MTRNREIHLAAYPRGRAPEPSDFELVETDVPEPGDGEVLIRNTWMSVDPYMRGRMNGVRTYAEAYTVGEPMFGGAVGEVVESRSGRFNPGDVVRSNLGWRQYGVADAGAVEPVDSSQAPPQAYLGVLGMPGLSAWVGLGMAEPKAGDTLFVSGAAGAVGSMVGQLAKVRGLRVVGSAGSDAKVDWLTGELGFDAAFNYKATDIGKGLEEAAPDGIDIYFDNVGGDHLQAALSAMREQGRITMCGAISSYNAAAPPPGPPNLMMIVVRRLTVRGFIVFDHFHREGEFVAEVAPLLADGRIVARETVVEGVESAPAALMGLLDGENIGKMLVKLA
jgi:NADPH-dependent curcumin reductase CurA